MFIVDSTQYRRYLDLLSLMVGKFYKPPSICRDKAPLAHTGAAQDWTHASIGVQLQLADIGSTNYYVDWAKDDPCKKEHQNQQGQRIKMRTVIPPFHIDINL